MTLSWITAVFGVICFASFSYTLPIEDADFLELFLLKNDPIKKLDQTFTSLKETDIHTFDDLDRDDTIVILHERGEIPERMEHFESQIREWHDNDKDDLDKVIISMINGKGDLPENTMEYSKSQIREWHDNDKGNKSPFKSLDDSIAYYRNSLNGKTTDDSDIVEALEVLRNFVASSVKEKEERQMNIHIPSSFERNGDKSLPDGPRNSSAPTLLPQYIDTTDIDAHTTSTINQEAEPSVDTLPDICQSAYLDTIELTQDGSTYAFKGDFYWKINYNVTAPGYPRKISDDWGGMEGNLDASFTWPGGKTYFFKGERCWRFTNKEMDSGYPKLISEVFKGIPNNLDAALVWSGNGIPYFFKGMEYWRYDVDTNPPVKDEYPALINAWKGLPRDGIDAAFVSDNSVSYFFKGGQYYRFNDATSEVSRQYQYPASTSYNWFSCKVDSY